MTWADVIKYAVSGAIVSWPVFLAGLWASHRKVRQHIDKVTGQQTAQIAEMTTEQTGQIAGELERRRHDTSRGDRPAGQYHGHGDTSS